MSDFSFPFQADMSSPREQESGETFSEKVERVVFSDDLKANTDEEISEAVGSIMKVASQSAKPRGETEFELNFQQRQFCIVVPHKSCPTGSSRAWYIWNNREGQPWQSDLEAHVANWRAKARPFNGTDERLGHAVIREMAKKEFHCDINHCYGGWGLCFYKEGVSESSSASDFNVAVCKAALQVLGVSDATMS